MIISILYKIENKLKFILMYFQVMVTFNFNFIYVLQLQILFYLLIMTIKRWFFQQIILLN